MFHCRFVTVFLITVWLFWTTAEESAVNGGPEKSDNPEIANLFKADQSSRANFFQMTPDQLDAMLMQDRERRARARARR